MRNKFIFNTIFGFLILLVVFILVGLFYVCIMLPYFLGITLLIILICYLIGFLFNQIYL
jgi:hypothetical protein